VLLGSRTGAWSHIALGLAALLAQRFAGSGGSHSGGSSSSSSSSRDSRAGDPAPISPAFGVDVDSGRGNEPHPPSQAHPADPPTPPTPQTDRSRDRSAHRLPDLHVHVSHARPGPKAGLASTSSADASREPDNSNDPNGPSDPLQSLATRWALVVVCPGRGREGTHMCDYRRVGGRCVLRGSACMYVDMCMNACVWMSYVLLKLKYVCIIIFVIIIIIIMIKDLLLFLFLLLLLLLL
jgi:hypothetical protein